MKQFQVFQRNAQDRVAIKISGYPWAALLFPPLWAIRKGLPLQGMILAVLYGTCAAMMSAGANGVVIGAASLLWLGVFTAHNATDWPTSLYEKRGYRSIGGIEAGSAEEALLHMPREPKRPTVRLESIPPEQRTAMLAFTRSGTVV
jgi:hypothetical protein